MQNHGVIENKEFYYSVNAGVYSTKTMNPEEMKLERTVEITTKLGKKLSGEVTWL
uniref:Uncharacterized protein n=1 Tax=Pithovirus LCPAC403 TaxID=2506596 RepID=A0A481ZCI9_9VIRU|nr:MAG: hypothetical protein LCPAC403_01860 [Pithovirus LCPAC403]